MTDRPGLLLTSKQAFILEDPPEGDQAQTETYLITGSATTSPLSAAAVGNAAAESPFFELLASQTETAITIHLGLLTTLLVAVPSLPAAAIANKCIDLYTRYVLGAFPLCHEATIRATASRFLIPLSASENHAENRALVSLCFLADSEHERIGAFRSITLLTALCAAVSCVVPETLLPSKHIVAPLFLRASRETLRIYEDYDLEHPDSSSLGIRHFFSSAIQSATGLYGAAFHFLNQAGLVAMKMRLYDERSLKGLDPVEETLLRNTFWQLYVCDQTALVMKGRPVVIHEPLFETEFTVQTHSQTAVPLLLHDEYSNGIRLEESLSTGFHIICRLWTMAARVIRGMELLSGKKAPDAVIIDMERRSDAVARLSAVYFEVITLSSELPATSAAGLLDDSSPNSYHRDADQHLLEILQRQRTSYLLTLYSIKAFVLNTAIHCNMPEVVGMNAEPMTLFMKQIELANDFLHSLESVPFVHLQTEGEHCSEKIRRIGSVLLKITHDATDEVVKTRANQCAERLVDMLARLNSKASDILVQQMDL
ncbi:unnamed protein product [Clonostachys solani]|uniref:Transcription factor domain-containing protein n=1 Tax=Clonostachys solani TaxID=160281 RepID=A0A9P0EN03_9HYPO|nr:unnamed protein product [Clonostachys solani]